MLDAPSDVPLWLTEWNRGPNLQTLTSRASTSGETFIKRCVAFLFFSLPPPPPPLTPCLLVILTVRSCQRRWGSWSHFISATQKGDWIWWSTHFLFCQRCWISRYTWDEVRKLKCTFNNKLWIHLNVQTEQNVCGEPRCRPCFRHGGCRDRRTVIVAPLIRNTQAEHTQKQMREHGRLVVWGAKSVLCCSPLTLLHLLRLLRFYFNCRSAQSA